ncbi:MAG: glycosyltransferase family 1 protein [Chloroflexi bacterium]|nr:glycosyltransferase family 1 protein [Chloroflexota bacterium]
MTRFLFYSAPLPGHMDWGGMHRTAATLRAEGHDVLWVTEPYGKPHLERLDIPVRTVHHTGWHWPPPPMPQGLSPQEQAKERERRAVAVWLNPERVLPAVEELTTVVREWRPHVLVTEPFTAAAGFVAEKERIPLMVAGWPATEMPTKVPPQQAEAARLAQRWFSQMKEALGSQGTYWAPGPLPWLRSPLAHVVYFVPEWYGKWKVLSPPTFFVGGIPPEPGPLPPDLEPLTRRSPLVLITLGSAFTQDRNFFLLALEAVLRSGGIPLIATGDEALARDLRAQFPEAEVHAWLPFDAIFPHLALAVHHGGVGTTHAALVHGVPQLIVPHAADQYYQAARVQRMGVGVALRVSQVNATVLRSYVRTLLHEPLWEEQAAHVARRMAMFGGVPWAARILALLALTVD